MKNTYLNRDEFIKTVHTLCCAHLIRIKDLVLLFELYILTGNQYDVFNMTLWHSLLFSCLFGAEEIPYALLHVKHDIIYTCSPTFSPSMARGLFLARKS